MLDELMLGGEIQETSKKNVLKAIQAQDLLQEVRVIFSYYIWNPYTPLWKILDKIFQRE